MKYSVVINKKLKYMRVYKVNRHLGEQSNFLTKMFMRIFSQENKRKGA